MIALDAKLINNKFNYVFVVGIVVVAKLNKISWEMLIRKNSKKRKFEQIYSFASKD